MVLAIGAAIALAGIGAVRTLQEPALPTVASTRADGVSAQQKIYELSRPGGRQATVVLTERELDAFLSRHLGEAAELPVTGLAVRLPSEDIADVAARVPMRALLGELSLGSLTGVLPRRWLERGLWLRVQARPRMEAAAGARPRRYLRVDIERLYVGRQRLPSFLLRHLLHPTALGLLRWPLPERVHDVRVEPGRLVFLTASP